MSSAAVGWLFTLGALMHNMEEALFLPAWSRHAGRWHPRVSTTEFRFAVAVLSAALVMCMAAAAIHGAGSPAAHIFAGYVLAMIINAGVPHLIATIAQRRYMPGTFTALLFNLPLGVLFLIQGLSERYIVLRQFAWYGPVTVILLLASIPVLFAIGRRLRPRQAGPGTPKSYKKQS
jgi:hypothetical protein